MLREIRRSIILALVLAVILCGAYPLLVTGIGKLFFPSKVDGGIIRLQDGRIVGAKLIGQAFSKPEYFHGRPSAAGNGYDASNSSGSNLGPTSQKLADTLRANIDQALKENPTLKKGEIPVDMVTASGSGLDPDISPENAYAQADRVARARGMSVDDVKSMIRKHIQGPELGLFGEPVVNVLLLNVDLDSLSKKGA